MLHWVASYAPGVIRNDLPVLLGRLPHKLEQLYFVLGCNRKCRKISLQWDNKFHWNWVMRERWPICDCDRIQLRKASTHMFCVKGKQDGCLKALHALFFFGLEEKTNRDAASVIRCRIGRSSAWLDAVLGSGTSSTWIPVSGKPSTVGAAVEEMWPFSSGWLWHSCEEIVQTHDCPTSTLSKLCSHRFQSGDRILDGCSWNPK